MLKHLRWDEIEREQLNPTLERQYITAEKLTMARFRLSKGSVVPTQSHDSEQLSYVLEGALKFNLGGKDVVVRSGEVLCIPSNLSHSAEALEDTFVLDVFSPVRSDWVNGQDSYLRK